MSKTTYEKFRFIPYLAYVGVGESTRFNSQLLSPWQDPSPYVDWDSLNAWIIGGSFEWKGFAPLRLAVDAYYSARTQDHQYDNSKNYEENGFQIALGHFIKLKMMLYHYEIGMQVAINIIAMVALNMVNHLLFMLACTIVISLWEVGY